MSDAAAARRKATNITLEPELLKLAKQFDVNLSQAAEAGIAQAVARRRAEKWLEANAQALASSNEYVEKNGLPLSGFRNF